LNEEYRSAGYAGFTFAVRYSLFNIPDLLFPELEGPHADIFHIALSYITSKDRSLKASKTDSKRRPELSNLCFLAGRDGISGQILKSIRGCRLPTALMRVRASCWNCPQWLQEHG
jgi:hypothetical protein